MSAQSFVFASHLSCESIRILAVALETSIIAYKRSCSKEELPNDFLQTGCANFSHGQTQFLAPTLARSVCRQSFGFSSFEQELLLGRLRAQKRA